MEQSVGLRPRGAAIFTAALMISICCVVSAQAQTIHTLAYVTNTASNVVQVADIDANSIITAIQVGNDPEDIEASPDGNFMYVSNKGDGTVSMISTNAQAVVATIPVGAAPEGVAVSPDGASVYVANTNSDTVSVIDTGSASVRATVGVGTCPGHFAIAPGGNPIYVTNKGDGTLSVIDSGSLKVTGNISVGRFPWFVALSPNGSVAYVTNIASSTVTMVSISSQSILETIPVGGGPWGVIVNHDSYYPWVYVTNADDGTVSVLGWDGWVNRTITVASNTNVYEAALTPGGNSLLVPDYTNGTLSIYKVRWSSLRGDGQMSLGGTPTAVASIHEQAS